LAEVYCNPEKKSNLILDRRNTGKISRMGWGKDVEKYKSGILYFFHTVANDPGSVLIGILFKPIRAHPSSNPPLITVGEKMLHRKPNASQSELILPPILPSSQLAKRQSSSIFKSFPHHN
jgi:hypothetical protein